MRIIRDYQFIADEDRGACVAIGNFDGVHLGHQAVIDVVRGIADKSGSPLGILTFEPHPREYFAPDAPAFKLMSAEAKANRLEKLGVQHLYQLNFNAALSALDAREFARDVIHGALGLTHVVVGADFCFGKGRKGNAETLIAYGKEFGFGVTIAELVKDGEQIFSSTAIRNALSEGRPEDAATMLGHLHRIEGPVIQGDQRGRELASRRRICPSTDCTHQNTVSTQLRLIFLMGHHKAATLARIHWRTPHVWRLQTKPRSVPVRFPRRHLRREHFRGLGRLPTPELKFDTLEPLIEQMDLDCAQARETLGKIYPTGL